MVGMALVALVVVPVTGQQQTFRAVARGVVTSALVTLSGKPVDDLTASDFVLTDDAKPQQISVTRDTRPLDVTLWIEQVAADAWSDQIRRALVKLVAHLDPNDRVRVLLGAGFNRQVLAWQSPTTFADTFKLDAEASRSGARKFGGPSDQSVFDTLMTLGPPDRRQVVVGFFAGVGGRELGDDVLAATAASSDAVIYMVGLPLGGSTVIPSSWFGGVGRIATLTGGQLFVASDPGSTGDWSGQFHIRLTPGVPVDFGGATVSAFTDVEVAVAQMVSDLRHSYVISFAPEAPKLGWHTIAVKISNPKFEHAYVRARQKYYVPPA